jgi:hypothetical protein
MAQPKLSSFLFQKEPFISQNIWRGYQNDLLDSCELQFTAWSKLRLGLISCTLHPTKI